MQNYDDETQKRVKIIHHDLKAEINNLVQSQIGDVKHIFQYCFFTLTTIEDPYVCTRQCSCNLQSTYAREINNLETFVYFSTDEVFGPAMA